VFNFSCIALSLRDTLEIVLWQEANHFKILWLEANNLEMHLWQGRKC